jgi:hypothetical protein
MVVACEVYFLILFYWKGELYKVSDGRSGVSRDAI